MKIKTILILSALGYGGFKLYKKGENLFGKYKNAASQVSAKIHKVNDVDISGGKVNLDVDVKLINGSNQDFDFDTSGHLSLKAININSNAGKQLAHITSNLSAIDLPANGSTKVKNVSLVANLDDLGDIFSTALDILMNMDQIEKQLNVDLIIEAEGHEFTV